MKIVEKLSTYAALIGVIGAIGGGFYTWGQFNTRLDTIEKKEIVMDKQFFGVVITPLDTHLMSAIIGLYFGGSLVKK